MFAALFSFWRAPAQRYSTLLVMALAVIISLGISSYWHQYQYISSATQSADIYGNSLAKLAAEQSANSTLEKDPISLQAIARKIANKPAISSLVIYDNEHQILAQISGEATAQLTNQTLRFYTAPILASDNIIGSITLGVNPTQLQTPPSYQGLIVMILGLVGFALYCVYQIKQHPMSTALRVVEQEQTEQHETTASPTQAIANTETNDAIYLLLTINNASVLHQQLNGESRQLQLEQLEQHIQQSAKLYNGNIAALGSDTIILSFVGDKTDNIYNALYCGELILKLNQQAQRSVLSLNGFIQKPGQPQLTSALGGICRSLEHNMDELFLDADLITEYNLGSHLEIENVPNTSQALVKQFKGSYATLLENQLSQLQDQAKV